MRGILAPLSQEGGKSVVVGQGWRKLRESDLITSLLVLWRCHLLSRGKTRKLEESDGSLELIL